MTQPCGATLPRVQDPGWECNGSGLIVVLTWRLLSGALLPVVLPARALDVIEPEPWWELPVKQFQGGDHAHLCVPRRPTKWRGDTPFLFGDAVAAFKEIGGSVGGVSFGVSPAIVRGVVYIGGPL
jgi:hypothetical protein